MNEREAFEAWFKENSPVGGINAKLAARDAWLARAAVEAAQAQRVPDDGFAVNFVVHAGLDKHKARECERIVRELLASTPAPAQQEPSEAEMVCAEAYQVVGCLLSDLGLFETEAARKILDNLSEARMVHQDVLPWESATTHQEPPQPVERKPMTDEHETRVMKLMGVIDDLIEADPDRAERLIESILARNALRKRLASRHHGIRE